MGVGLCYLTPPMYGKVVNHYYTRHGNKIYVSTFISINLCATQRVPITTKVVSLNPVHGEVYSIQHYVIKFVSDRSVVFSILLPCRV
jgi:hypothetical protein